jgi:hypothetical protein
MAKAARPFAFAQGRPFDFAHDKLFDSTAARKAAMLVSAAMLTSPADRRLLRLRVLLRAI